MSDLEITVATYDPRVCGKRCQYRTNWRMNKTGAMFCAAFLKYLTFSSSQKYMGTPDVKRCAECLVYQPVDAVGVTP